MGAAYLVDQDSVGFTNRLKKCYKKEGYSFLKEMFGSDVTYSFMQDLILGHPLAIETIEQLYPVKNDRFYVLGSHDKKAFQRLENMELETEEMEEVFIQYYLDCSNLKLARILVDSPLNGTKIDIKFEERQEIDSLDFPKKTSVKINTPIDSIFINLDYNEPDLNDRKSIHLSIPDSYELCE